MQRAIVSLFLPALLACFPMAAQQAPWRIGIEADVNRLDFHRERDLHFEYPSAFSYKLQGVVYVKLADHIQGKTGLGIEQLVVEEIDYSLIFGADYQPGIGFDLRASFRETSFRGTFVTVPLSFQFFVDANNSALYLNLGANAMLQVYNETDIEITASGQRSPALDTQHSGLDIERLLLQAECGLGYSWLFPSGREMLVEILCRRVFSEPKEWEEFRSINDPDSIGGKRFQSVGLRLGFRF